MVNHVLLAFTTWNGRGRRRAHKMERTTKSVTSTWEASTCSLWHKSPAKNERAKSLKADADNTRKKSIYREKTRKRTTFHMYYMNVTWKIKKLKKPSPMSARMRAHTDRKSTHRKRKETNNRKQTRCGRQTGPSEGSKIRRVPSNAHLKHAKILQPRFKCPLSDLILRAHYRASRHMWSVCDLRDAYECGKNAQTERGHDYTEDL